MTKMTLNLQSIDIGGLSLKLQDGNRKLHTGFKDGFYFWKVLISVLLDLPRLLFFSTYALLVLFWAQIYHQARSLPTDKLRIAYISVNGGIYVIQI